MPLPQLTGVVLATRSTGGDRRWPVGTLALLALLALLVGGIFYAAVAHRAVPELAESVAAARGDVKPGANQGAAKARDAETAKGDPAVPPAVSPPVATNDHTPPAEEHALPGPSPTASTDSEDQSPTAHSGIAEGSLAPSEKPESEATESLPAEPLGLYAERTRPDRQNWVAEVGGNEESELGVADGLDWLARHQAEDGHWGPDCLGAEGSRCEKEQPCGGPGGAYEAALTGLAVLAFQAAGNYDFNEHPYTENVRRGLDWLVARQGANGEIVGSRSPRVFAPGGRVYYDERYMYEHGIATFALAEACAVARSAQRHADERYLAGATRAVKFIEAQQHDDGGWRYRPMKADRSDTSVSGWAMLALKTAGEADLQVNPATTAKMSEFFNRMADPSTGRTRYIGWQYVSDATTGVGMLVDEFINHQPESARIHLAAAYLADRAEARWGDEPRDDQPDVRLRAPDYYLWYNCTLAMFLAGGEPWDRWNKVVRNHVLSLQVHGSDCARGSWEPEGQWATEGGRVFSTALAVLTLEVYYRFARNVQRQP